MSHKKAGEALGHTSTQGLLLVLAVGTGADAVTDAAGRDAAAPVIAQEARPVRLCHTGLGPWRARRGSKDGDQGDQSCKSCQQEHQEG